MSDNEKIGFMHALCMGRIAEDLILPFPKLGEEETETLHSVIDAVSQLLKPRQASFREWDRDGEFPAEFIEEIKAFGLFGLVIPEAYGGMAMGSAAYSRTLQEVARYDASVAVTVGAHSSIGMKGLLLFGTEEQKQRWLPRLATGEMVAAFCLTEPGAGSDAASIKTQAVRDGDDWVLNGSKLWITNGGIADFFTVFAKTPSEGGRGKMTAFIVTKDLPGVSISPHEDKMGLRASSTTSVYFDNVRVPHFNVLGDVGHGFKVAMRILNSGRTGLGGGAVGMMKQAIALTTKQANERVQFGKPIREFGLVKLKVGKMVVSCYAAEAAVNMVAGLIDGGEEEYAVEAAISKVFASEALWETVDEALQTAGGNGYMCEFPYERMLRDCRINRIFEGTNDILRLFIALTAMRDVGGQLQELSSTLKGVFDAPIKGFGVLSDYAMKHVSLVTGFRSSTFSKLHPALKDQAGIFEVSMQDLARASDRILRKHGRKIIEKQLATKRLADIMIDLFVFACVLSRVDTAINDLGLEAAQRELAIANVFARQARGRIQRNFGLIDDNDDEELKALANDAFSAERYQWDVI